MQVARFYICSFNLPPASHVYDARARYHFYAGCHAPQAATASEQVAIASRARMCSRWRGIAEQIGSPGGHCLAAHHIMRNALVIWEAVH
jgi:hypothetical protein